MEYETIFGQVVSKANNYQAVPDVYNGARIIKSQALRNYEASFVRQCRVYKDRNLNMPFVLTLHVFEKSNAYDLDNSIKTVLDCLQYAGAIRDDNLCMSIKAKKHIDRGNPRIVFAIEPYVLVNDLFATTVQT